MTEKLLKRLLGLVEPIRELEMLFAVILERNLQLLATPRDAERRYPEVLGQKQLWPARFRPQ